MVNRWWMDVITYMNKISRNRRCILKSWEMTRCAALILTLNFEKWWPLTHQKSRKTPHGNHECLSKTFLFIHQVHVSVGNIEIVTCCVRDMTPDQIKTSACVFLLTTCVQWAACCVWVQRWSGRRGKGCWIRLGEAERSQWWTAADELAPPGWSWTPRPRTTSSPVAIQDKHAQTFWLWKNNAKKSWLTFSLKCHDPPTITAWALKSCTFISPVPHINSWRG